MVSRIFVLDGEQQNVCTKVLLVILVLSGVVIAITLCIYTFKSNSVYWPACPPPKLDSNSLSNWTMESEYITYACFSGYTLEGNVSVVSRCDLNDTKQWIPSPPKCIHNPYLPIILECPINQKGFEGNITIWQTATYAPIHLAGSINITNVEKKEGVLSDLFRLSYTSSCSVTHEIINSTRIPTCPEGAPNCMGIFFNSTGLIPYKEMELRTTLVFIDANNTVGIVSLHQDHTTLVMHIPSIITSVENTTTITTTTTTTSTATTTTALVDNNSSPTTQPTTTEATSSTIPNRKYQLRYNEYHN